ncbi:DUF6249 domain-containing protein [Bacteroides zoogleoformans]|uniref:DUF6249 domain-containing protein n=1 Tax=Bacteroides zoogleoformans TaxID=28119 RepID=UPI00248F3ED9|nr:DUF6249 domain-containing protein [Bacteroides zoogleoformans]
MKRIILGLMLAMTFFSLAQGKNRIVRENDSEGNTKRVIELRDTMVNGETQTDTLSIMTYESSQSGENNSYSDDYRNESRQRHNNWSWDEFDLSGHASETLIAITAIVFVFGLPLLIIFTIFFFRYKNRKAKYRLAEQALANGQQLPGNFFKETSDTDNHTKGISSIFTGIGLFIFLWAITGRFAIGCIGLLIMFTGFGQLVIYYTQQSKGEHPFIRTDRDEKDRNSDVKTRGIESSNREKKNEEK